MRKREGTPSRRDPFISLAANSPPGVARERFVGATSQVQRDFSRLPSSCA